jgi:transposase
LTDAETQEIHRLAHARIAPARTVERAQIVWRAHQGERVPAIARALGRSEATIRLWLTRFNAQGVAGLRDGARAGRPPTYTSEERGEVVAASLTNPGDLGLPFGSWTLDRLAAYLNEARSIPIKRSRIGEILQAEGLRWRTQETWFGERVDPAFVEKRGRSSPSTHRHPRQVS